MGVDDTRLSTLRRRTEFTDKELHNERTQAIQA